MRQVKQIMRTFVMTGVVLFVLHGFIFPEVTAFAEEEEGYVEITGTATVNFVAEEETAGDCGTDGVKLGDITHIGAEEAWAGERVSLDEYSLEGVYLVVRGEVSPAPGCEIERVSVSTDDGNSWEDADVAGDGSWEYRFVPAEDTTYNITASAVAYRASR